MSAYELNYCKVAPMLRPICFLIILISLSGAACAQGDSFRMECPDSDYKVLPGENLLELKSRIEKRLEALGLNVLWRMNWSSRFVAKGSSFQDSPEDLARLRTLSKILVPSLEKYSSYFFQRIRLKNIVIVKDLVVARQLRKAMPHPSSSSLFYGDNNDLECLPGMEARVHHELYHFVEERINGSMYFQDKIWLGLNPTDFHYGRGGKSVYNLNVPFQNLGHPQEGFVSNYSLTAVEEDKAEVFGWWMTKGYSDRLLLWTTQDSILAQKAQYLQAAMKELGLYL